MSIVDSRRFLIIVFLILIRVLSLFPKWHSTFWFLYRSWFRQMFESTGSVGWKEKCSIMQRNTRKRELFRQRAKILNMRKDQVNQNTINFTPDVVYREKKNIIRTHQGIPFSFSVVELSSTWYFTMPGHHAVLLFIPNPTSIMSSLHVGAASPYAHSSKSALTQGGNAMLVCRRTSNKTQ